MHSLEDMRGIVMNKLSFVTAQLAHFAWGAYLPFLIARAHYYHPFAATLLIAAAKESAEALGIAPWEPKQTWLSSAVDFGFFLLGVSTTAYLFGYIM